MATLEDKLLGEKLENYCDSDEGEHEEDRDPNAPPPEPPISLQEQGQPPPFIQGSVRGAPSQNTGPKGVLRDWELYQAHEAILRKEKDAELIRLVKATSLSCSTVGDDEKVQETMEKLQEEMSSDDLDNLFSDSALEQFIQQRMSLRMSEMNQKNPLFGQGLVSLTSGDQFLQVIDSSGPLIPVIIHIYDAKFPECSTMNHSLSQLSEMYPQVQFCKVKADIVGVSMNFKAKGVPALLVYKGGNLVGNFVQLKEEFGNEFYHGDVENFLIENGMIEDRSNVPTLLAKKKEGMMGGRINT